MLERICSIDGCGNRINARGLCGKHYNQVRNGKLDHPAAAEILRKIPCSEAGCDSPAYARGYCTMHYQRWAHTGDPGEAAPRKATYRPTDLCGVPGCGKRAQVMGYCRTHHRRLSRFKLTHGELEAMLRSQRGRCAICRTAKPGTQSGEWCVDHDHVTGQVRGLLCGMCNSGIGFLKDDPEIIKAAERYVAKHRQMVLI